MKQLVGKNKILCAIILIIIAGIIMVIVKGFNVENSYKEHYRIIVDMKGQFNNEDVEKITKDIFNEDITVQKATKMNDFVAISVSSISEENKLELVNKLNEKFNLNLLVDDLVIDYIPHTKLIDLIKPYIVPFIIIECLIAIYIAIRFRKNNLIKSVLRFFEYTIIAELIMFSIIAIIRMPVGKFLLTEIIIAYVISSIMIFSKLEKEKIKNEQELK